MNEGTYVRHRAYDVAIQTLNRIYAETVLGRIAWERNDDVDYSAKISDEYPFPISFDFQGVESYPRSFTSRAFVDLQMPGMNERFFNGTEGFELMYSLLLFIETGNEHLDRYSDALTRLELALKDAAKKSG